MDQKEISKLLKALDNQENESLLELDHSKIKSDKNNILQRMQFSGDDVKKYHKTLKNYRYVDEIKDLKYGAFLRWFNLQKIPDIKLVTGGVLCDIRILDEGVHLVCKNFSNKYMQIKMDECIIFQKITDEERVLLDVMKYLNN